MEKIKLNTEKGFYCEINQKYYPTIRGLLNYLRTVPITSKEYYLKYLGEVGTCEVCGKETSFDRLNTGYKKYCSAVCAVKSESHRKAVSQRFVGDDEKFLKSLEKKRLTYSKLTESEKAQIYQKIVTSKKEKYGNDHFSQKAKLQWKSKTKDEIKNIVSKINSTKIKNGTMYVPPYKNSNKDITIDGKLFKVQGYEDIALTLLSELVDVNSIKTGNEVPRINLPNGKKYYPDICINNLLIEVKSEYTYKVDLSENILKQKKSLDSGYNHIFLVIHSKDLTKERTLKNKNEYLNTLHKAISSHCLNDKVQRLSRDWE